MTKDIVGDYWGARYFDPAFNRAEWQAHPVSLERLTRIQGGMMREEWFANKYLVAKAERAIGIGVGRAETEIALLAKGYVEHFDLFDVSPVGLGHAKATAISLGLSDRLTCHCLDINSGNLAPDSYDLVTFVASLHHMTDLGKTLEIVYSALKAGGLLWAANEYIGPNRFAYPEDDLKIVRAFHAALPERFRKHGDAILHLPTPEEVAANDPSEAPVSSEIVSQMRYVFSEVELTDLYGSFAFMLFWGLNHDALYETPEGARLVELILTMDQGLVECGALPGYFAHLVARKSAAI